MPAKPFVQSIIHPWVWGVVVSALGLAGEVVLGLADARVNSAPAWEDPRFWVWLASPCMAWALACWLSRNYFLTSLVFAIGATATHLGGYAMLWFDAHRVKTPGGMNPFATNSINLTAMISAFLQWVAFVFVLFIAGFVFWREHSQRVAGDQPVSSLEE